MKKQINRDGNVLLCAKREISMAPRVVRDRTKYNRKQKHKALHS